MGRSVEGPLSPLACICFPRVRQSWSVWKVKTWTHFSTWVVAAVCYCWVVDAYEEATCRGEWGTHAPPDFCTNSGVQVMGLQPE